MEKHFKRTLITTALPYANGPVHIGHLAGVYVPADIYARYLRLKGEEVLMIGGSDEHGVPITLRAKKEGVTPQDVVDRFHGIIKKSFRGVWHLVRYLFTHNFVYSSSGSVGLFPYPVYEKESLSRRPANNITTRKPNSSLPTVI